MRPRTAAGCHTEPGKPVNSGGRRYDGPFGTVFSANITPERDTGIGAWTDEQIITAIRLGRRPNGDRLIPVHPYPVCNGMAEEDLRGLVAFLRTLPPIHRSTSPKHIIVPLFETVFLPAWLAAFSPRETPPPTAPASGLARGEYLVRAIGHCGECHTPRTVTFAVDNSRFLAGNQKLPDGTAVPNITPDKETGLRWAEEEIAVAKSTVETYRVRHRSPPSPTWRAFLFLKTHVPELVALDFFTVPTVGFKVLFVLIVLAHERRRVLQFNVTEHPTARWTAQQLVEAFPWDTAPKYLLRDRDAMYGNLFQRCVKSLGIEQVLAAPRSPWQNACVERLIGSIRRECLDHVMAFSEGHLRRILASYFHYYHRWRTHLSLAMDCLEARPVLPPDQGTVIEFLEVGGLHHHYDRLAA